MQCKFVSYTIEALSIIIINHTKIFNRKLEMNVRTHYYPHTLKYFIKLFI